MNPVTRQPDAYVGIILPRPNCKDISEIRLRHLNIDTQLKQFIYQFCRESIEASFIGANKIYSAASSFGHEDHVRGDEQNTRLGIWYWVPGIWCWVLGIGYCVLGIRPLVHFF